MNPIPHGMRTGFRLTKDDRQVYKVLDLFYVLSVEHWADLDKVISELLKQAWKQQESVVKADESTDELVSFYLTLEEYDAYYFQDSTFDTRVKHEALHIFNSWKSDMELTNMQRYWMKCGLSSILDLVNPKST
ncbi:hypothetical protein G6F62_001014 [Rhizopus arrhizus]|nr:hypothetical protein G6F24_006803 [Rhizopus arrhizus]KAG0948042.1 hypothetical protein G6F32_005957 [Rhizopus arrhizus]KAG1358088.1 hypothetical protein G6F62_001014 [Rhizopus arrhizus]